jgi:hypothetical protein
LLAFATGIQFLRKRAGGTMRKLFAVAANAALLCPHKQVTNKSISDVFAPQGKLYVLPDRVVPVFGVGITDRRREA